MLNLDTHILIFFVTKELNDHEFRCMVNQPLAISDIVLWELAMLAKANRLRMDLDDAEFKSFFHTLTVIPITLDIARASTQLDFSSDPADQIIAATSIVEKIPLLTRNRRIRQSQMVPLAF